MPKIRFKRTVLQSMSFLPQLGYRPREPRAGELVPFSKNSADGTTYEIEFQLMSNFAPPVRGLNVWLFRRCSPMPLNATSSCTPLAMDLPNVLRGFYRLDMFSAGAFPWEFNDEPSLLNVLTSTKDLLIDYGIRWLEDPASNLDWVKHPLVRK